MAVHSFNVISLLCLVLCTSVQALALDVNDTVSIRAAARTIADGLFSFYKNNATDTTITDVGLFPYPPYYWWESGAVWAGMVDYAAYTNDSSYTTTTVQALIAQKGPDNNYIMPNQRFDEGNDDQAFWGLGLMSALENNFPTTATQSPASVQWLPALTALLENQTARWDNASCGGGLKWQIYPENSYGYDYKNAVSNGAYFQLAARLARFTGNATYLALAERTWDWCAAVGLIDAHTFAVYDGADDKLNCSQLDHTQWTYNSALFLAGAAAMWNVTRDRMWMARVDSLLANANKTFFSPFPNATGVVYEAACEIQGGCDVDQFSFKAYMARWLGKTAVLAPWTKSRILPLLQASAQAAARSCAGNGNVTLCRYRWYMPGFEGSSGVGQQLSALETVQSLLVWEAGAPAVMMKTNATADTTTALKRLPTARRTAEWIVDVVSPSTSS